MDSIPHGSIYIIQNMVSNKVYVGQTMGKLSDRWGKHKNALNRGVHGNSHLQSAWIKYGAQSFEFALLETYATHDQINEAECFYLEYFRSLGVDLYNIRAGGSHGTHSKETREKLRVARLKQTPPDATARANMRAAQLGRKLSEATLAKLRGRVVSEETKAKLRAAGMGKRHEPDRIEKNRTAHLGISVKMSEAGRASMSKAQLNYHQKAYIFRSPDGVIVHVQNLAPFAKDYGLRVPNLSAVVHGTKKSHLGWTFVGFGR